MKINPISRSDFNDLAVQAPIPAIVIKNDHESGVQIAAYNFMWEDTGNAVVVQCAGKPVETLKVGDSVLYARQPGRGTLQPASPGDPHAIAELHEARQEFLPAMFGN